MSLYIRDDRVDALAERLQAETGARTKTEAVRLALEHELARIEAARSFEARNAQVFALAERLGLPNPDFDQKRFSDEMWGD